MKVIFTPNNELIITSSNHYEAIRIALALEREFSDRDVVAVLRTVIRHAKESGIEGITLDVPSREERSPL